MNVRPHEKEGRELAKQVARRAKNTFKKQTNNKVSSYVIRLRHLGGIPREPLSRGSKVVGHAAADEKEPVVTGCGWLRAHIQCPPSGVCRVM